MTMDRTLKIHGGLARARNVLSRDERIARLMDEGKFDPAVNCPLGLPKTKVRHSKAGMKTKKAAEAVPAAGTPAEGEAAAAAGAATPAQAAKAPAGKTPEAKAERTKGEKGRERK